MLQGTPGEPKCVPVFGETDEKPMITNVDEKPAPVKTAVVELPVVETPQQQPQPVAVETSPLPNIMMQQQPQQPQLQSKKPQFTFKFDPSVSRKNTGVFNQQLIAKHMPHLLQPQVGRQQQPTEQTQPQQQQQQQKPVVEPTQPIVAAPIVPEVSTLFPFKQQQPINSLFEPMIRPIPITNCNVSGKLEIVFLFFYCKFLLII